MNYQCISHTISLISLANALLPLSKVPCTDDKLVSNVHIPPNVDSALLLEAFRHEKSLSKADHMAEAHDRCYFALKKKVTLIRV